MQIIKRRELVESTTYYRYFERRDSRGGFIFECDEQGNLLSPHENYDLCMTGLVDGEVMIDRGIESRYHRYFEDAIGLCDCGREVYLHGFTNTCECGADYNMSGQRLAPREQWGEETGESLSEILNIR